MIKLGNSHAIRCDTELSRDPDTVWPDKSAIKNKPDTVCV